MSGIAAIFNRTGLPVDPALPVRMLESMAHRGPDGQSVWTSGPVAIGHVALSTVHGDGIGRQPVLIGNRGLCLAMDGRIDNAGELRAALASARAPMRTDAELMLAAYAAWGEDALNRVLGDFAVVIWDEREQRLICARDIVGLRSLYYAVDQDAFICGSEPQSLFAGGLTRSDINEGMVGEHLVHRVTSREETLYRDVLRLPSAHVMVVDRGALRKRRYFDLDPARSIRHRSDREYADHFLQLFRQAVACRLPPSGVAGAYLSGGLDSSSIVCLIEDLRRARALDGLELRTFSMTDVGDPDDESGYIRDVVSRWNLNATVLPVTPVSLDASVDQVRRYRDTPELPNVFAARGLAVAARAAGIRVMLTGLGGDDWLCAAATHLPGLLAELRLAAFVRQLIVEYEPQRWRDLVRPFMTRGVWPLLPRGLRAFVSRVRGRDGLPPYINRAFARRIALAERLAPPPFDARSPTLAQNELYQWLWSGTMAFSHEIDDRYHASLGLDARHPLHDRRLIEFALAIPEEQRWRGPATKFVLREAMGGLLPATVRNRLSKGDYSRTHIRAFDACGGETCFQSLETARRGWVDPRVLLETYREMRRRFAAGDSDYASYTCRLWAVFGIELWLRYAGRTNDG